MKVIRGKMINYGGFDFVPSLRKFPMKKEPSKLMKMSIKQMKKTRICYMVSTGNTYNNGNRQGDDNVSKRDTSHVAVVPRTNNLACSFGPSNGMKSLHEHIEKSMHASSRIVRNNTSKACSSRPRNGMKSSHENIENSMPPSSSIVRKNTEMSRPSFVKANNGAVSSQINTKSSSSSPNTRMAICLQNDTRRSRPSSLRPDNGIDYLNKNTNGGALPLKNIEKPRTCSLRLNKSEASLSENIEIPRYSCSIPSDDMVSSPTKPKNVLVPLRGNNESLMCRPSHLSNGSSSVKDDSNSMVGISKESHPTSSRIAAQAVNGEAQKEDLPATVETSKLSSKLKSNQDKIGIIHRQMDKVSCMATSEERHEDPMGKHIQIDSRKRNNGLSEHGGTGANKLKRTLMETLLEENRETLEDVDNEEPEIRRPRARRRKLILDDDDDGDQNLEGVEIGTAGLATQQCGSLPIDEPVWSGIIKMGGQKTVPLAAHLSTKCCEEAWNLAESLQQEIVVTKLSKLEAWPKSFEASRPTGDNIALYFLPCEMRQDAGLDQLVKEVVENDVVLQAVVGEAEMLIFPSIILPEQHRTFQGKPYLWAVFKRRKNKVPTVNGNEHGKGRCAEDDVGKEQASDSSVDKGVHSVARLNTETGPEAPEQMEQEQNPSLARANTRPSPAATGDPTMNAATSASHGQIIHSSLAVPTGALFGFVVQPNPRIEQLIQEMQREGAVVVAMRGKMIGSGLG